LRRCWLLLGKDYPLSFKQAEQFFNMLLVAESANTDLPSTGFCNEPLLEAKYALVCCSTLRNAKGDAYKKNGISALF
jgi:hypothetical protein